MGLNRLLSFGKKGNENRDRILVMCVGCIGDVIMVTPALRALKRHFKDCPIDVLLRRDSREILKNCPYINQILIYPGSRVFELTRGYRFFYKLYQKGYTKVILLRECFSGYGAVYGRFIALLTGAPVRVGIPNGQVKRLFGKDDFLLTHTCRNFRRHWALCCLDLLRPLGIEDSDCGTEV